MRSGTMTLLVAEFHNGESIARLVRSALRREIAAVTLMAKPRGSGVHQLQLKLQGKHCVTLGAEPMGRDESGRHKLLLAPLDPSNESELRVVARALGGTDPSADPKPRASDAPPRTRPLDSQIFDQSPPLPAAPAEEVPAKPPRPEGLERPEGPDANDLSVSRAVIMDAGALGLHPDDDDDDDALTVPGRQSMAPSEPIGPDGAFPPPPISPTLEVAGAAPTSLRSITAAVDSTQPSRHTGLDDAETAAAAARMGIPAPSARRQPEVPRSRDRTGNRPITKEVMPMPEGTQARDRGARPSDIEIVDVGDVDVELESASHASPSTAPSRVDPRASRDAVPSSPPRPSPARASRFDPRRTLRDPVAGRTLADGKYAVQGLIGAGAIGAVYRGVQPGLERPVAVKVLHPGTKPSAAVLKRFRTEALTASQVDHRNITRIHDLGQEPDGLVYIVMELLHGRSLQQILDEEQRLEPQRAIRLMMQVCAALSAAHERDIVHRDVKPDNVVVVRARDDDGDEIELAKVCDFGIATLAGLAPEDAGHSAGTPDYMAPEQARGAHVDARADVYACGVMLFELAVGRAPFDGDSAAAVLAKHASEPPPRPSALVGGLPRGYDAVVLRALAKSPQERQQTARELRTELKKLLAD